MSNNGGRYTHKVGSVGKALGRHHSSLGNKQLFTSHHFQTNYAPHVAPNDAGFTPIHHGNVGVNQVRNNSAPGQMGWKVRGPKGRGN